MRQQQAIAALAAAYMAVVASGAPLPVFTLLAWSGVPIKSAERYPCENCPCGCGSAEHCWRQCCCHTLGERLAWARREGVRPPESALDQAEHEGHDVSRWRATSEAPAVLAATSQDDNVSLPPCCRKRLQRVQQRSCCEAQPKTATPPAKQGVSLIRAMACQGVAEAWLAMGAAPVPPVFTPQHPDTTTYVEDSPAPLWRHVDEGPTPPPPELAARYLAISIA